MPTGHADADVQRWIEFRRIYGLRTDLEWVLAVADSPEALRSYGVPLLEFEEAQVIRLQLNAEALLDFVHGYGNRYPDEFGGVWIEAPFVVIALTDRIPEHRAAIQALFGPNVVVRQVQFTLRDLKIWAADVGEQAAWFDTIGAHLVEADAEQTLNRVEVSYRAPDQTVEAQILAKFGNPPWIEFDYRGPGPWTGPRGDIELTVVDEDGRPAAFECLFISLDPRVSSEFPPRDVADGECFQRELEAVRWRVDITYERDGERVTVSREVSVPANGVAQLTVVIEP